MSFDWGKVKTATEKCRATHDGTIPEHYVLWLPENTTTAIIELAEDLFPDHEVQRGAVPAPIFGSPWMSYDIQTLRDWTGNAVHRPRPGRISTGRVMGDYRDYLTDVFPGAEQERMEEILRLESRIDALDASISYRRYTDDGKWSCAP